MAHFGVYMYPYNNEVTLGNFSMPYSSKTMTLYKGVNNTLSFTIHNADGKYALIRDDEFLLFKIYDARSDKQIFNIVLDKVQPSWLSEAGQQRPTLGNKIKVYYGCVVPCGVIQDCGVGTKYRWSIEKINTTNNIETVELLYTNHDYKTTGELIVSNSNNPTFIESTEISSERNSSWKPVNNAYLYDISKDYRNVYEVLATSAIPAGVQYGLVDGLSTVALYFKDFKGRVRIQGSLVNDSPKDADDYKWFDIDIGDNIDSAWSEDDMINGIKSYNFKGNYMWLRVLVLIPPEIVSYEPYESIVTFDPLRTLPKILIRR